MEPTKDEAETLKIAQYFEQGAAAIQLVLGELDRIVEEAHEAMIGIVAPPPEMALAHLTRYQQRLAIRRHLQNFIDASKQAKQDIVEQLTSGEESNGNESDDTASDRY